MDFDLFTNMNSGVALAVLGYFGFIFKDIPFRIFDLIKQKLSITIQASNYSDIVYDSINNWCLSRFPTLEAHIQKEGWSSMNVVDTIATDTYYFMYDWCTVVIISKFREGETSSERVKYGIRVTAIGLNRYAVLEDYKKFMDNILPDADKFIKADIVRTEEHGFSTTLIHKKSFDDVFFKEKNKIKSILDNFIVNKNYFNEHGITYKTGFLFYGYPGSGKSTLARAIASYLGWNIIIINNYSDLPTYNLSNKVILIEDIDCMFNNREDGVVEDITKRKSFTLDLQSILNFIDGVASPSGCVFIATTNYIDKIDPALKRKGRFDHVFEIPYIDKELGKEMCKRFNVPESILDNFDFPVSAANIQAEIFYNKIKEG